MNLRGVLRALGQLMIVLSITLSGVAVWSLIDYGMGHADARGATRSLAIGMIFGSLLGLGLWRIGHGSGRTYLGRREGLFLVALTWILGCLVAAVPYLFWAWDSGPTGHVFGRWSAAYFEAVSGLTTTGATVLGDIEAMPRGLLLWRSLTQWLGGLGIVVLFVAVLPNLGVSGKRIYNVESTAPAHSSVKPRISETAKILWIIYLLLSLTLLIIFRILGMGWFDGINHTFTVMATGGFSTKNASMGHFQSFWIDGVAILFMFISGINYGLLYRVSRHGLRELIKDPEFRLYACLMIVASLTIALIILNKTFITTAMDPETGEPVVIGRGFFEALRYSTFQTVSLQTSSGFATADYDQWNFAGKFMLVFLMFVGGSAGSTSGGFKVVRVLVAIKAIMAEFERYFRPNVVRPIRLGRQPIAPELRLAVLVYLITGLSLWALGSLALMVLEDGNSVLAEQDKAMTFTTAATASIATLNNIGPGLHQVGPTGSYGWFSSPSLVLMSAMMLLGRLEIFTILVILTPRFWKNE
ncbi:MAG: TrkH family potassium uptake protein [Phycisphaeraceae bacterium]|nr:TrkH family potassium uptake protein [Phycisphaeraceae bacterium]